MTTVETQNLNAGPSEDFMRSVKQALENLYNLPALERHPLALDAVPARRPGISPGQGLRSELIAGIEALNPGPNTPFRAPRGRNFQLLHLHYVEGLTVQEVAHELGLSERQAYRDLRNADESVAALLYAHRQKPAPAADAAEGERQKLASASSIQTEMARLETRSQPLDLVPLVQRVRKSVERLAAQKGASIATVAPSAPVEVTADPLLAQQLLTHLLSQIIQHAGPGVVLLELVPRPGGASIKINYTLQAAGANAPTGLPGGGLGASGVAQPLADRLGWRASQETLPDGQHLITLVVSNCGPSVLIVDDNQGLVELLQRYLSGQTCRVWAATSGNQGFEMASQLIPDAIILDVMMPDVDGWELLQRLRAHPATTNVPVVICSVFNDPELAFSLGASAFVSKPVDRAAILSALRQLGIL